MEHTFQFISSAQPNDAEFCMLVYRTAIRRDSLQVLNTRNRYNLFIPRWNEDILEHLPEQPCMIYLANPISPFFLLLVPRLDPTPTEIGCKYRDRPMVGRKSFEIRNMRLYNALYHPGGCNPILAYCLATQVSWLGG